MLLNTATAPKSNRTDDQIETNTDRSGDSYPTPESRSNVIPLPCVEQCDQGESRWHPPKEVIWIGHPLTLLALSLEWSMSAEKIQTQAMTTGTK